MLLQIVRLHEVEKVFLEPRPRLGKIPPFRCGLVASRLSVASCVLDELPLSDGKI
jgi:hypothetical protein